jgi:hypothetical protein
MEKKPAVRTNPISRRDTLFRRKKKRVLVTRTERIQTMPRGDKGSYTAKQKRKAEHIEEGYETRGVSKKEAEKRAWATVNKSDKGGKKSGSGRGKKSSKAPSRKGGKKSGGKKKR